MVVSHRDGGEPWWTLEYTSMVSLGQGGSWIRRKFLANLLNGIIPQRWWGTLVDLGIYLYGFLGPGWILDKKEILGEPVKWYNSTEMVVDLG